MKRSQSKTKRAVQHSKTMLKRWCSNCNIKLLLYFSDPNLPDIGEIEDVCKYVLAYTGKMNHTCQQEKTAIQDLITRWVPPKSWYKLYEDLNRKRILTYLYWSHIVVSSTHAGNMGGVRLITQKALYGMSAQRTLSIQEAVHMVNNQDLVIYSEKFTYLSLRRCAMLHN